MTTPLKTTESRLAWRCQVCGHTFRSLASASFSMTVGCPHCGDTDVDFTMPVDRTAAPETAS